MEEKKQGGKRNGAGRKPMPILNKKSTIILYVPNADILKFGGKEKFISKHNEFTENFGKEIKFAEITPESYDGKKMDGYISDEFGQTGKIENKPFVAPKNVAPVTYHTERQETPNLSPFDGYKMEFKDARTISEVQEILSRMKMDMFLTIPQKGLLEKLGKEATKEMYTD